MYGRGVFNCPALPDGFRPNLAYNLVAGGIGVDYKVKRYLYVRGDWEYQNWFGFQNSSLSPAFSPSAPPTTSNSALFPAKAKPRSAPGLSRLSRNLYLDLYLDL